jgi:hypothetical protein
MAQSQPKVLGKNTTLAVAWRLPTLNDFLLADVNGIRFVMPDMGLPGTQRLVPDTSQGNASGSNTITATTYRTDKFNIWLFDVLTGHTGQGQYALSYPIRCVGRGGN